MEIKRRRGEGEKDKVIKVGRPYQLGRLPEI